MWSGIESGVHDYCFLPFWLEIEGEIVGIQGLESFGFKLTKILEFH